MIESILKKYMQPIIKEATEEAYKKGAEDTIRRFAFVYDEVRNIAREDARAEAGEIPIEEIDEELSQTMFEEIANV
jgi:hypothetical protein